MTKEQRENALKVLKGCHIKEPHKDNNYRPVSSLKEGSEIEIKNRKSEFFSCRNKKRFESQSDAMKIVNYYKNRKGGDWTRVYYCEICRRYHITSKPLIPSKTKKVNLNKRCKTKCKMAMKKN